MTALLGLMVFAVVKTRDFQGQTHEVMEGSSGGLGRKTPASPAVHMTQQA